MLLARLLYQACRGLSNQLRKPTFPPRSKRSSSATATAIGWSHTRSPIASRNPTPSASISNATLSQDVALLRQKYQNDPRILEALDLAELPADADDLIHRRTGCDEWAAKLHAHPDRAPGIEAARAYLKCDAVAKDEAALRQKYSGKPAILKWIDAKWVHIVKRVPLKIVPKRIRRTRRRDHPISSIAESTRAFRSRLSSRARSCSPLRHTQHFCWLVATKSAFLAPVCRPLTRVRSPGNAPSLALSLAFGPGVR